MPYSDSCMALPVLVAGRYRYDWDLFTDWCIATDRLPLPATPSTLAGFLHEHPATTATQRRRVSAVNAVHRDHGYPSPGRSEIVRRHLDTIRAARLDQLAAQLQVRAEALPTAGWPASLFGRRDALLLLLAAAGMTFTQISRLSRGDLTTDGGVLIATTSDGEQFQLSPCAAGVDRTPAGDIYRRWAEVLAFLDRHPNTRMLGTYLSDPQGIFVPEPTARQAKQPLLQPIDRWGHLPLPAQTMTPQSVGSLVRAHLDGRPPIRRPISLSDDPGHLRGAERPIEDSIELDPDYYERGVRARRHTHQQLADVTEILDEVEDHADRILSELLAVLDNL
ncbi:hypothetical protein P9990_26215 (plasmid) [Prescottella equi]|uniref:hypothetical protein n=1 Tax=Rhodococcus hoagii TaxID=43767 RepID=UPI0025770F94|nr:hypothetical protein [Prescottella equi]WJJ14314.1 hypothetical protein P9990_26215 [Prescottella equi]